MRALLADRLAGRPTRANFRTGHLTICTLMPMRSVPHRVVCLLGLDDGVFPRRAPRDGDDLILTDPHVGDRDARAEDRQLLLDALLAATDKLIVTYAGRDERTNLPRPPAVPVGELLDVVDRTVRVVEAEARDQVLVEHPLQPFDPRNFTPDRLVAGRTWSFDRVTLAGAERARRPAARPATVPRRRRSSASPARWSRWRTSCASCSTRCARSCASGSASPPATSPTSSRTGCRSSSTAWTAGRPASACSMPAWPASTPRTAALAERARGLLPPGVLGFPVVAGLFPTVERLVAAAEPGADRVGRRAGAAARRARAGRDGARRR